MIQRREFEETIRNQNRIIALLVKRSGGKVTFSTTEIDEMMTGDDPEVFMTRDDIYRSATLEYRP